jgi:hypothetical protein
MRHRGLLGYRNIRVKPFSATAMGTGRWTVALSHLSSFTATEVASHRFCIEIAPRLAAAKRALWRITGRGAPRLLAVTAYHRRTKTPDRILCRDERQVSVIGAVPLCAFPRPGPGRGTKICPARRRGDQEQRAQTDTKKEKSRSELDYGPIPP